MLSGIATPCVYCHRVPSRVKTFCRIISRFSGVGIAQYFRIGSQASPRPSSYAFPFCEMIAATRSGWAIIEHIERIPFYSECFRESFYRPGQCVERVGIFSFDRHLCKSEAWQIRRDYPVIIGKPWNEFTEHERRCREPV